LEESNTWDGKVATLLNAFESFIEQDAESLLVKQAVRKLSELDATGIPPSQADFTRWVEEVLQDEVIPAGRFQRNGPTVVNLMAARGVPFKIVIIPGMVEKSFPPLIGQDAILLDQERKVLNRVLGGKEKEPLPLKAEGRLEEERLLFRLAIGAAREKLILSFPRIEIGTGRERLPSSFLLAAVKALTGKSIDFQESEISTEEPVPLKLAGQTVNLRGRIDRIDLTKDGKKARVRDYKSGNKLGKENDFQGGRTLQLPLYLLAAKQLLENLHRGIQVESAEYYFLKEKKKSRHIKFDFSALEAKETELQEILKTIAGSIEEGVFIAAPDYQCDYCDFEMICGNWTPMLFDRKAKDPRVKRYLEMRTGEKEDTGEESEG